MKSIPKLSLIILITTILAGGSCLPPEGKNIPKSTVLPTDPPGSNTAPIVPPPVVVIPPAPPPTPTPVVSLSDIYNNLDDYSCGGRACVNAETPYYSARVVEGNLSKTLVNIPTDIEDLENLLMSTFSALLPSDSGYVCVVGAAEGADENCSGSSAPIAVNFSSANRGADDGTGVIIGNILPSTYADKVVFYLNETAPTEAEIGDRLAISAVVLGFDGANLYVGTDADVNGTVYNCAPLASFTPCIDIALDNFADYPEVDGRVLLPAMLATLRAGQLFTMFPAASNNVVRDMLLGGGGDCIVHLRCFLITESFSPSQQDLYENPLDYSCGGRACVNAETPYYSALVAEGDDSGLTKTHLHFPENAYSPLTTLIEKLAPNYSCNDPCSGTPEAQIELGRGSSARVYISFISLTRQPWNNEKVLNILPSNYRFSNNADFYVGTGDGHYVCVDSAPCIDIPLSNSIFDNFTNGEKNYQLPLALAALRAGQLFTLFPNASNNTVVDMLLNKKADGTTDTKCIVLLQCLAIADSFTTSSAGEAGSTTGALASAGSAGSASSGSSSSAGSANSFIADIGSMTTYGKRQVFWSDGGLSVETRSHKIYRGGAHAMALAYRSMMGTLDITTGWTSQSSALGMEQMFFSGSSLGVFGALRYDAGSYLGMRPYVGVVASWHSMLETPKSITIMTANEVHVRAGVDVDVKGMRFALEGRCGQHQRLISYGALSSALAQTSCSTHLKASVSF